MRFSLIAFACAALAALPMGASAQAVRDCNTFEANARNLMGPPEIAVQSFANGDVRVLGLDVGEPACCSAHLMVTYFTDLEPFPICALISAGPQQGFSGLIMQQLSAGYDPSIGLILTLPAGRYNGSSSVMSPLQVVINRATATVTARHY